MKLAIKALLGLWVLFLLAGLILPKEYEIKRSTRIQSDIGSVHTQTNNLKNWQKWQLWASIDPSIKITLGDKTEGVGASQSWSSKSGNGKLTLTQSDPEQGIEYNISFNDGANKAKASLSYRPVSATETEIVWHMKGQLETPIFGAYLALFMDSMVGQSFDLGLFRLKKLVETGQAE